MAKKRILTDDEIKKIFIRKCTKVLSDRTLQVYRKRLEELLDDNVQSSSKSKYLQYKAVLSKLAEMGIALNVKLMKYSRRGDSVKKNILDRYVSPEQLHMILDAIPDTVKGNELRRTIKIAYYSGLRLAEVLALRGSDVVLNNHIRLNVSGKGSKSRSSYLPREQKELIDGFIGFTITEDYVKKTIRRVSEKTGINFSFHSLRHSFASNFMRAGGNITLLQRLLGHSSLNTTAIYLHCIDESDQLARLGF
jgi:integrase